jgi:hypothetical protein
LPGSSTPEFQAWHEVLSRALIDAICHDHPFAIPWPQLHWPP